MLEEGDRRRRVVEVPGEAAIVEVDDLHRVAVDQKIGEAHVAMDQAEALRRLAEFFEPPPDQRDRAPEERGLRRVDPHAVGPAPPMRPLAEARVEIPGEALEVRRPLPALRMLVHARRHLAEHAELFDEMSRLRRLAPRLPFEEDDMAWPRHRRVPDRLDQARRRGRAPERA